MKRVIGILMLLCISTMLMAQNRVDLLSTNMSKYVGKVNKEAFEQLVGEPTAENGEFIVYTVTNTYSLELTDIECFYREKDGILISVKFTAKSYLGYWIDIVMTKGYNKKYGIVKKEFGEIVDVKESTPWITMHIFNIRKMGGTEIATINYSVGCQKK